MPASDGKRPRNFSSRCNAPVSDLRAACGAKLPSKALRLSDLLPRHLMGKNLPILDAQAVPAAGRQIKPRVRLNIVFWDPFAQGIQNAEAELSVRVSLICGQAKPIRGFRVVLRDAKPVS